MNITKNNGSKLFVKVRDYEPSIMINYELIALSSGKLISIDRGQATDKYSSKLIFSGTKTDMYAIITALQDLRNNNKEVILTEIDDSFFGEHVDHTVPIKCVINTISDMVSPKLNLFTFDISLITTDLTFLS